MYRVMTTWSQLACNVTSFLQLIARQPPDKGDSARQRLILNGRLSVRVLQVPMHPLAPVLHCDRQRYAQ